MNTITKGRVSLPTILAAGFMLALALTLFGCSGDGGDDSCKAGGDLFDLSCSDDGGGSFNENSQVYNGYYDYDHVLNIGIAYTGSGNVRMRVKIKGSPQKTIEAGSVKNGIFNLALPQTISDEYLTDDIKNNSMITKGKNCNISAEDVKFTDEHIFELYDSNEERIGGYLFNSDEKEKEFIGHFYFSKPIKIICDNVDVDAKAGLNRIYFNSERKISTNNILTKEVKWVYTND